jgi:RimJ/RimL family protein N-acetyltransferase
MTILETSRTCLRELSTSDAPFFLELANSEGWLRFIGDRQLRTSEDAARYLENGVIRHYAEHGFGLWLVEDKVSGDKLGICGLISRPGLDHPDVGFAFLPRFYGQGYASETVAATLRYAATKLGLATVCAITLPDNTGSINVLKKAGLDFERTIELNAESLSLYSCRLPE